MPRTDSDGLLPWSNKAYIGNGIFAGGPDGDRPVVEFGLGHGRSITGGLARNGIATAAAGDVVLSSAMATSHQLDTSLEVLTNLLYWIRRSLDDPARAEAYLDVADQVLADIAARRRIAPPGSVNGLP